MPGLGRLAVRQAETILAILLLLFVGQKAIRRYQQWGGAQPLNLRGSHWLRLTPTETARLTVTVSELSRNCQAVLTVPGLYSFSLWSGVPPVEEKRVNIWPFLWPDEIQKHELPKLRQMNRGCVLVSQDMYRFFQNFAVSPGKEELVPEVKRTMRLIFAIQDVTLYQSSATSQPTSTSALSPNYQRTPPADK